MVPWCSLECTPACQAGGRGFKSRRDRGESADSHGRVAQLAERPPEKRKVTGSTPVPTTIAGQVLQHLACGAPGPNRSSPPAVSERSSENEGTWRDRMPTRRRTNERGSSP